MDDNDKKSKLKPISIALGVGLTVSLATSPLAHSASNPFHVVKVSHDGSDTHAKDGSCGAKDGSCGATESGKAKEGSCGEGKCGGDSEKSTDHSSKGKEGSCGEGKCGG